MYYTWFKDLENPVRVPGGLDKGGPTVQPTKKHQKYKNMNKEEMDNLLTSLDSVDLF